MNKNKRHSGSNGIIGGQQQGARKEPIGKKRKKQKLAGEKSNVDQVIYNNNDTYNIII